MGLLFFKTNWLYGFPIPITRGIRASGNSGKKASWNPKLPIADNAKLPKGSFGIPIDDKLRFNGYNKKEVNKWK